MEIDLHALRKSVHYDPKAGTFTTLRGKDALRRRLGGRMSVVIGGKAYPAEDLAWLWCYHMLPHGKLEPVNGKPDDLRIENWRKCVVFESKSDPKPRKRRALSRTNTSGHAGVSWSHRDQRWRAYASDGGVWQCLGHFKEKADAINCREAFLASHQSPLK